MDLPVVAVDLPGHGRSSWREDHDYRPRHLADDIAVAVDALARVPAVVVGMSMGGMAAAALASAHPEQVAGLVLVDVTPNAAPAGHDPTVALLRRESTFPSFGELVRVTAEHNPRRSEASIRRGLRHNARELPDGRWTWRYDELPAWTDGRHGPLAPELWDAIGGLEVPVLLVRGDRSAVVSDHDVEHLRRIRPGATVTTIEGAGHDVQGEQPVALADVLRVFLARLRLASRAAPVDGRAGRLRR